MGYYVERIDSYQSDPTIQRTTTMTLRRRMQMTASTAVATEMSTWTIHSTAKAKAMTSLI
jgi:hypothetical protein